MDSTLEEDIITKALQMVVRGVRQLQTAPPRADASTAEQLHIIIDALSRLVEAASEGEEL